jgi:RNase H-like domain found in reverse transcriptase
VKWQWTPEEQSTFDSLKSAVTSTPILAFPDNSCPFCIEADSSDFAMGAVLSQQSPESRKWHPVAFLSKSLSPVEQNYKIYDKEMLAIIWEMEVWRQFLEGAEHQFEVWTDHKNLEYFMMAKKLNCRQACWSLLLAHFEFLLHHLGSGDNSDITLLTPVHMFQSLISFS